MFAILHARFLAPEIKLFEIRVPRIARKQRAGQFVIVRLHEHGERIPLTIDDSDPDAGVDHARRPRRRQDDPPHEPLGAGDSIRDVVGPLGKPSEVQRFGTVVVIGGGVGTAIAYPTARALKDAGNRVVSHRRRADADLVILEDEVRRDRATRPTS